MTHYNSSTNQEIKRKFVKREVLTCFSYEIQAVLSAGVEQVGINKELPDWEDVENLYNRECPYCGNDAEEDKDICPDCEKDGHIEEYEEKPQDIFEWWIVTDYFYRKLKELGYPVLEWGNNCYWGRCTTGQAILLDHVISTICDEMEILEGQKYDWSK